MRSPRSFIDRRSYTVTGLGAGASATGRLPGGVELRHFPLPEIAMRELRVRDRQVRLAHAALAPADDVQVQGAGPPAHARLALAAALRLDRVQVPQQIARRGRGLEPHHRVPERALG